LAQELGLHKGKGFYKLVSMIESFHHKLQ